MGDVLKMKGRELNTSMLAATLRQIYNFTKGKILGGVTGGIEPSRKGFGLAQR